MLKTYKNEVSLTPIIEEWKWKDRHDKYHSIKNMETRHLFFTLRMIWNHTVEEQYKLKPYNKYTFNEFYTNKYMCEAVYTMMKEIVMRKDLEKQWIIELNIMAGTLKKLKTLKEVNNQKGDTIQIDLMDEIV